MIKHLSLFLSLSLAWCKPIDSDKQIAKYNSEDDLFIYDDSQQSVIRVSEFISILQDSNALLRDDLVKKVNLNIEKYINKKKNTQLVKKDTIRELKQRMA
mgnify:CR=1 FL=1